jgi:hypothetical protein
LVVCWLFKLIKNKKKKKNKEKRLFEDWKGLLFSIAPLVANTNVKKRKKAEEVSSGLRVSQT